MLAGVFALREWIDEVAGQELTADPAFFARVSEFKEVLKGSSPLELDKRDQINSLISLRLAARAAKNWAESDRIRDELAGLGIQLKDGKDEAGNPITTWEVKR